MARVDKTTMGSGIAAVLASLGLAGSQYIEKDALAEQLAVCSAATVQMANKLIDARILDGRSDREVYDEVSPMLARSTGE